MSNWIDFNIEKPPFDGWYIVWDETNNNSKPGYYCRGDWENIYTTISHWQYIPKDKPNKTSI